MWEYRIWKCEICWNEAQHAIYSKYVNLGLFNPPKDPSQYSQWMNDTETLRKQYLEEYHNPNVLHTMCWEVPCYEDNVFICKKCLMQVLQEFPLGG